MANRLNLLFSSEPPCTNSARILSKFWNFCTTYRLGLTWRISYTITLSSNDWFQRIVEGWSSCAEISDAPSWNEVLHIERRYVCCDAHSYYVLRELHTRLE